MRDDDIHNLALLHIILFAVGCLWIWILAAGIEKQIERLGSPCKSSSCSSEQSRRAA